MERVHFRDINHLIGLYPQLGFLPKERQSDLFDVVTTASQMDPVHRFSLEEVLEVLPSLKSPALEIEKSDFLVESGNLYTREDRDILDPNIDVDFTTYPFADIKDVASTWASRKGDHRQAVLINSCYMASQDAVMLTLEPSLLRTRRHYILAHATSVEVLRPFYFDIVGTGQRRKNKPRSYQLEMELYCLGVSDCRLVDSTNQRRGGLARRLLVHMPLDLPELDGKWSACILPSLRSGREVFLHPSKTTFNLQPIHHPAVLPELVIPKHLQQLVA